MNQNTNTRIVPMLATLIVGILMGYGQRTLGDELLPHFQWDNPYDDAMWIPVAREDAEILCADSPIEANRLLCIADAQKYGVIAKWWAKYSSDRTLHIGEELRYQAEGKPQGLDRQQYRNQRIMTGSKVKSEQPISVQLRRRIEEIEIEIGKLERFKKRLEHDLQTLEKGH